MCGICARFFKTETKNGDFETISARIKHRGPDNTKSVIDHDETCQVQMIFHRLAINGLSKIGDQPFLYEFGETKYRVECNGEIYNFVDLIIEHKLTNVDQSQLDIAKISDCYIIGLLYHKFGIDATAKMLKGEFSFCVSEWNEGKFVQFVACRSRTGQRKLTISQKGGELSLCSEAHGLMFDQNTVIRQFPPRTYAILKPDGELKSTEYYDFSDIKTKVYDWDEAVSGTRSRLIKAVNVRFDMVSRDCKFCDNRCGKCKRRIAFLLSGGLDSSLTAAIGARRAAEFGQKIATFSIGFKDSPDLLAAREVAKFIGSDHTEYVETEKTMLEALVTTPFVTESYDITTNRASDFQHVLAQRIKRDFPDIIVMIGGDGADEVWCGYRDCYRAPTPEAAHLHTIRRLNEIHYYDVTRFDLSVARCGQEARTPHLDDDLIEWALSIDPKLRIPMEAKNGEFKGKMEKLILREAFVGYLPNSILYRRKEAFSDGVSKIERSWFSIIGEFFDKLISDQDFETEKNKYKYLPPKTKEAYFYRKQFESRFGAQNAEMLPGFWLQEWSPETKGDPSARTMSIY